MLEEAFIGWLSGALGLSFRGCQPQPGGVELMLQEAAVGGHGDALPGAGCCLLLPQGTAHCRGPQPQGVAVALELSGMSSALLCSGGGMQPRSAKR